MRVIAPRDTPAPLHFKLTGGFQCIVDPFCNWA